MADKHELLEITLENMSQGITLFDENLNVLVLNRRYKELLGFPDDLATPGTHLSEFFRYNAERGEYGDGDVKTLVRERIELAEKFEPHRFRRSRPDGTVLEIVGTPLEDGGFVTTYQDVTAQVRAKGTIRASEEHLEHLVSHRTQELVASERRFRSLTDMLPLSICETDVSGRITYVNRRAAETFGYPFGDVEAYPAIQEMAAPDERERARKNTAKVLKRGEERSSGTEYVMQRRDGSLFPALVYSAPILENGNPVGTRSAIVNISDRKTVELQLIEAKEETETANQTKSDFLASMSHELRTPLNAVLGFAQILQLDRQNPLTVTQKEYLDGILDGGQHLLELVDEILDLAKIEADQLVLSPEDVNACEIVADCIALSIPIGESRGVQVVDTLCHGPPVFLRTDRLRFRQVLLNLLSNAVKYNKTGGSVTVSGEDRGNGFVRISVTDTGVGIAEEDVGSVFHMFHRVGADPMKASEGTGIGLTVTKLLVEKMAGRIGFDSEVGVGSTFWIELPLASNAKVLIWTEDLRVAIDDIDRDHQVIFSLFNRVTHHFPDEQELDAIIGDLIDYTRAHFKREEAIMETCGYPDTEKHRAAHQLLTERVMALSDSWRRNRDPEDFYELRTFLRDWWVGHILHVDSTITGYAKGREGDIRAALDSLS